MARRPTKTIIPNTGTVTVSHVQLIRHQGRTLASVEAEDDGLVVWRKRTRGGKYDRHFTPWDRVVTYCAGDGGRKSQAYALVQDHLVLFCKTGEIVRNAELGTVTLTDALGEVHVITVAKLPDPGISVSIVYEAGRPSNADGAEEAEPAARRAPDGRRRGKTVELPADDEFETAADDDGDVDPFDESDSESDGDAGTNAPADGGDVGDDLEEPAPKRRGRAPPEDPDEFAEVAKKRSRASAEEVEAPRGRKTRQEPVEEPVRKKRPVTPEPVKAPRTGRAKTPEPTRRDRTSASNSWG